MFQVDSLPALLFVICRVSLAQMLRKVESGYTFKNGIMEPPSVYG